MNYFVNENIFTLNSGTEFSAIKRLKMFKNHQVEAKILTRNYNSQLSGDLKRVGLTHDDVINMYDYFQEVMNVPEKDVDVRYTEKIDKRKQSKGDMLHNTKKHMKMTTLIVALVLVAAGAFASVVSYHQGYTKGEKDGEINMLNYQALFKNNTTASETSSENTTTAAGETTAAAETESAQ